MRIKVRISDLSNDRLQNFEIVERPRLELAPPRDVVDRHLVTGSWLLLDNQDGPQPQLQPVDEEQHRFSLGDGEIFNLHGEDVLSLQVRDSLVGEDGRLTGAGRQVEQALLNYLEQHPDDMNCRFTIELQLTGNAFGGTSHTLGVHASRNEDGELSFELFDPNLDRLGGNRRIHSPERFEGLLARHIEDNYGHVDKIDIYQARIEPVVEDNDIQIVEDNDNEDNLVLPLEDDNNEGFNIINE
jgi:hypothetical protein